MKVTMHMEVDLETVPTEDLQGLVELGLMELDRRKKLSSALAEGTFRGSTITELMQAVDKVTKQ